MKILNFCFSEPDIPSRKEPARSRGDDSRRDRDRPSRKRRDERDRSPKRRKKFEKEDDDSFDPMDPSAYSDAPKGMWCFLRDKIRN